MLLRQALEQTRVGCPAPVLFNSLAVVLDSIDEVAAVQHRLLDVRYRTVHNRASIMSVQTANATPGAQAS